MSKKTTFLWIVSLLFLTVFMQTAWSDVYMNLKEHTDSYEIRGILQPSQNYITEYWITPSKSVVSNDKNKVIMDMEKNTITMVLHENKTYTVMPLNLSQALEQKNNDLSTDKNANMLEAMSKIMQGKMTVTATNSRRRLGNWNCYQYLQTIENGEGEMASVTKSEIWASPDIKIDKQMYTKFAASMMAQNPGMIQNMDTIIKETEKIDGVPVSTSSSTLIMGITITSSSKLLDYKEGTAPADVFAIPSDYQKAELFQ